MIFRSLGRISNAAVTAAAAVAASENGKFKSVLVASRALSQRCRVIN